MNINPYNTFITDEKPILQGRILLFAPKSNSKGKYDATGAFHPELKNFCKLYHLTDKTKICYFDNTKSRNDMATEVLNFLEKENPSVLAFFCHGFAHGIQPGIRSRLHPAANKLDLANYEKFLSLLSRDPAPTIILYACSTGDDPDGDPDSAPGSGDGSFADTLRDDLVERGCLYTRVFAHTTAGHATANPFIKIFDGPESKMGAELLFQPGTLDFKKFKSKLNNDPDFRFQIPFMRVDRIRELIS